MSHQTPDIARYLPYLRRYARALTGSQERGDHYVRFCLETLIAEPEVLGAGPSSQLQLYKLFHQIWARIAERLDHGEPAEGPMPGRLESYIQALPPAERQILLLTAVEGFSTEDAGEILGIGADRAEELLEAARAQLTDQAVTSVLVIEDEPIIAFDIVRIVTEMGHAVVGTATTKDEAIAMAKAKDPGIVLADIKLGDGSSGIDAVGEILESMDVPVIFVTAYPERLLTGERKEPAYLVTKPFEPDELKVTIYQAILSTKKPASLPAAG